MKFSEIKIDVKYFAKSRKIFSLNLVKKFCAYFVEQPHPEFDYEGSNFDFFVQRQKTASVRFFSQVAFFDKLLQGVKNRHRPNFLQTRFWLFFSRYFFLMSIPTPKMRVQHRIADSARRTKDRPPSS